MDEKRIFSLIGISLVVSLAACRPVLAIGWGEIAIILVLVLLLVGPMLWRVFRFITRSREGDKNERN